MGRAFQESLARSSKGTAEAWFPWVGRPSPDIKREDSENKAKEARWRGMGDTKTSDTEPALDAREASQLSSEPVSRERTREQLSVEANPQYHSRF